MGSTSLGTPSLLFQKPDNHASPPEQPEEPEGPYEHVLDFLIRRKLLGKVLKDLKPNIPTLFSLARVCKATWQLLAANADLWRDVYLDNDPLITPQLRKRLVKSTYCDQSACITYKRTGLKQSKWLRCCTFLFHKPKLVLVLAGKDPIVVRRLGQPEAAAQYIHLGINYHLDSYLDDDEARFSMEFPQVFQDLEVGDLVITRDFKGAGCWTAFPSPLPDERLYLALRKNGTDTSGLGILHKDLAPPSLPLFFFSDANIDEELLDKQALVDKQVYWISYSHLKDKSMFSWADHEVFEEL